MQSKLLVSLSALALLACNSCVTVPNTKAVSVAGTMSAGAIWAETQTARTGDMTLNELLDFIEAQPARDCVPLGHWDEKTKTVWVKDFDVCAEDQAHGRVMHLPERGAAILQSADDWNKNKSALEQACRELGSKCSYEVKKAIKRMSVAKVKAR